MTRVLAMLRCDAKLQYRYGLYAVSVLMILVWGVVLGLLIRNAGVSAEAVVPLFLTANLQITTFYFAGALVLLEKSEGVLTALVITPLRDVEYLASKVASLTALAVAEGLLIVVLLFGMPPNPMWLLPGAVLLAVFYTLAGFVFIVRYDSINECLVPSVGVVTFLMLPLLHHFELTGRAMFYLHPVEPALGLMRAAYDGGGPWQIAYGAVASIAWCIVMFVWARRRFSRFIIRAAGV